MTRGRAQLLIPSGHPALAGHFPGHPVVPGVVLLDEVVHLLDADERACAAAEGRADAAELRAPGVSSGWHISSVKFHRLVLPEQPLTLHYAADATGSIRFELRLADALVASGALQRRASTAPNQAGT